jgi:hypothetical protein
LGRLDRHSFFDFWFGFDFDARRLRFNRNRFRRSSFLHGYRCFHFPRFDNFFDRGGRDFGWCVHTQFLAQPVG